MSANDILDRPPEDAAPATDGGEALWDAEPAIVKPRPGGRAPKAAAPADGPAEAASAPEPSWRAEDVLATFRMGGAAAPPIVAGAVPLLNLAHELRARPTLPDLAALRETCVAAVRAYERDLAAARVPPDRARAAHYALCATVDDVVLSRAAGDDTANAPGASDWARSGLVSTFHMDVTGGERVFDLLDHFHRDPGSNRDILLLLYLCLSLGFEGRTRVSARGALELAQTREGLYRTLRAQFGTFERELSPHWRGVNARHRPLRTAVAVWAAAGLAVLLLAIGYLVAAFAIGDASDATMTRLASVASAAPPSLARIERPEPVVEVARAEPTPAPVIRPAAPEPEIVAPPPPPDPLDVFLAFLRQEVNEGLVTLTRKDDKVLVRIRNTGLFASGSTDINRDFMGLLNRIGAALASENYRATVVGHTDDRPIRTVRFPSNWELSQSRADAVAGVLRSYVGAARVDAEGKADTDPVADNATPEGREANRRTDILVHGRAPNADYRTREVDGRKLLRRPELSPLPEDRTARPAPSADAVPTAARKEIAR